MVRRLSWSKQRHHGVMLTLLCVSFAASTRLVAQVSEDVFVTDTRPLAAAIKEFEKRCRCVVTYEDVRWGKDQVEVSPILRSQSDGTSARVPSGTPFTFTVPRDLSQAEIADSLRHVMGQFESSQNPGEFKLVQGQTSLHVLPAQSPILETPISVTANDTPALVAIQAALDDLGRVAGEEVGLWRVPLNLLKRPIRVAASNQPAYEVLGRLLAAVDKRLSCHLFHDVNANSYFLTIYLAYH